MPKSSKGGLWAPVLRRDPCSYCNGKGGTLDHIVPLVAGGTSKHTNLTSACNGCNSAKSDTPLLLFMLERYGAPRPKQPRKRKARRPYASRQAARRLTWTLAELLGAPTP